MDKEIIMQLDCLRSLYGTQLNKVERLRKYIDTLKDLIAGEKAEVKCCNPFIRHQKVTTSSYELAFFPFISWGESHIEKFEYLEIPDSFYTHLIKLGERKLKIMEMELEKLEKRIEDF